MIETQTLLLAAEVHKLAREYRCAERDKDLGAYDEAMRAIKLVEWYQANPLTKYVEMAYRDIANVVTQMREFERDDQRDEPRDDQRDDQLKKESENLMKCSAEKSTSGR
jgi:hypothetical protein